MRFWKKKPELGYILELKLIYPFKEETEREGYPPAAVKSLYGDLEINLGYEFFFEKNDCQFALAAWKRMKELVKAHPGYKIEIIRSVCVCKGGKERKIDIYNARLDHLFRHFWRCPKPILEPSGS